MNHLFCVLKKLQLKNGIFSRRIIDSNVTKRITVLDIPCIQGYVLA